MDSVLRDLSFLFIYLDDILVTRSSRVEHVAYHRTPLEWLSQHGLIVHHDAHREPPHFPYNGSFHVLEIGDKTFLVDIGSKLNHLKPVQLDLDWSVGLAQPPWRACPPTLPPGPQGH